MEARGLYEVYGYNAVCFDGVRAAGPSRGIALVRLAR